MKKCIKTLLFILFCMLLIIPVESNASVKISAKTAAVTVGDSIRLKVTGTKKKVSWKSSSSKTASVSSKGIVKARKAGSVTITARVSGKKYTCKVKVEKPYINRTTVVLDTCYRKGVCYTNLTLKGTSRNAKWYSSNPDVAAITMDDHTCCVDAIYPGNCTIYAKLGSKTYQCNINVISTMDDVGISYENLKDYSYSDECLYMGVNYSQKLQTSFYPSYMTSQPADSIVWSSSNPSVANVSADGTITGIATGTAEITATCGDIEDSITVVVEQPALSADSVTIRRSESISGYTFKLNNCHTYNVQWTSSNEFLLSREWVDGCESCFIPKHTGSCYLTISVYGKTYTIPVNIVA